MEWSGRAKKDSGQKSLSTLFGIPLESQAQYKMKAVVISDSSIASVSFKCGLSMVLRDAGICMSLLLAKPGACARDMAGVWDNAHACDLGFTIAKCNYARHDFCMTQKIAKDVQDMVETAKRKAQPHTVFFVNDGRFS